MVPSLDCQDYSFVLSMLYLLFESSLGFALFDAGELDRVSRTPSAMLISEDWLNTYEEFSKLVSLKAFIRFNSESEAKKQVKATSKGILTVELSRFLNDNFPKSPKAILGVSAKSPAFGILNIRHRADTYTRRLLKGIRIHFERYMGLNPSDLEKAQRTLALSYSSAKVMCDTNGNDNMIIQGISVLDTLNKDCNSMAIRLKERFGCHFPELVNLVDDGYLYARVVKMIEDKSMLTDNHISTLADILGDEDKAKAVVEAAKVSMGHDLSPIDTMDIQRFAHLVTDFYEHREQHYHYIASKMNDIAPNLVSLVGAVIGARLISHSGSLINLAGFRPSTLQTLGTEESAYRAMETEENTREDEYGIIYQSSFIGRASERNKEEMAQFLAKKCSIASRIDYLLFGKGYTVFGEMLHKQVEEQLEFLENGITHTKHIDVMKLAIEEARKRVADLNLVSFPLCSG